MKPNRFVLFLGLLVLFTGLLLAVQARRAKLEVFWLTVAKLDTDNRTYAKTIGVYRGEVPNRDFAFEYPPTSAYLLGLSRLFTRSADPVRYVAFYPYSAALVLTLLLALWALVAYRASAPSRNLLAFTAIVGVALVITKIGVNRFDFQVALLVAIALTLAAPLARDGLGERLAKGRGFVSGAVLGVGAGLKLYPALFLPGLVRMRGWVAAAGFALALVPTGVLIALAGANGLAFLSYHTRRHFEMFSIYAAAARLLGVARVEIAFGCFEVRFPGESLLLPLSGLLTVAGALLPLLLLRRTKDGLDVLRVGTASLALFILFNKVGSPQYLVWPLGIAMAGVAFPLRRSLPLLVWAAAGVLVAAVEFQFVSPISRGIYGSILLKTVYLVGLTVAALRPILRESQENASPTAA